MGLRAKDRGEARDWVAKRAYFSRNHRRERSGHGGLRIIALSSLIESENPSGVGGRATRGA